MTASSCQRSQGPSGTRVGSSVRMHSQPTSGSGDATTRPPRAWARSCPPKQTPRTGTLRSIASAIKTLSRATHPSWVLFTDSIDPMTTTAANSSGSGSASPPRSALKFVNLESQCSGSSTEHPRILEGTMSKERHSPSGHVTITSLTLWAAFTRFRFVTRYSPSWPDHAGLDHLLLWARGLRAARFQVPYPVS